MEQFINKTTLKLNWIQFFQEITFKGNTWKKLTNKTYLKQSLKMKVSNKTTQSFMEIKNNCKINLFYLHCKLKKKITLNNKLLI